MDALRVLGYCPGGYSWEFLVGVCRPVRQILTLFQIKKCNFLHPFSDQTSKIHTCFQTWPLSRNYFTITRLEGKQKISSNPFRIRIFLFLSYSFGIRNNKYLHTLRSSLENHTRFQTRMGKVSTRFQTKTAQKPYPMGRHILTYVTEGSIPPPGAMDSVWLLARLKIIPDRASVHT